MIVDDEKKTKQTKSYAWLRGSVKDILGRSVYCGHWTKCVQGEEIEFTNEAIISVEMYEKTQTLLKAQEQKPRPQKRTNKYRKVLFDKNYGYAFRFRADKEGKDYCAYQTAELAAGCGKKQLPVEEVDDAVRRILTTEHQKATVMHRLIKEKGQNCLEQQRAEIQKKLRTQGEMLVRSEKKKMEAYQKLGRGELTEEEFECVLTEVKRIRGVVEKQFQREEKNLKQKKIALSMENPWMKLFFDCEETDEVTREILEKYVERIEIEQLCVSNVEVKEASWYLELPEEWRNEVGLRGDGGTDGTE